MSTKPICIYHSNCPDGFTAAWVAYHAFHGDIDLHGGTHQSGPPDVTDRDVYMVDFSYRRQVLAAMRDRARRVVVLDHHKTAEAALRGLPGIETVFDMNRSGARIAWDYWNAEIPYPKPLLHVEDHDLWYLALPLTREIYANISSHPYQIPVWDRLMATEPRELAKEGEPILRKQLKDVRELLPETTRRMNIAGHNVPIANLPYTHVNDAAHLLCEGEPFAGCYWDTPYGRVFDLRSSDAGVDVSEIAEQFGGGGHRNAAGFRLPYEAAATFEA